MAPASAEKVLFEDGFQRPDGPNPGNEWSEYLFRNGQSSPGETPWRLSGGTLFFETTGQGAYIEDFIESGKSFPADNIRIEIECQGVVTTSKGYVGPAFYLVPEGSAGTFGHPRSPQNSPIGVGAWYQWEMQGKSGMMVMANGRNLLKQGNDQAGEPGLETARFAGLNESGFALHTIVIRNGAITYSSPAFAERSWPLAKRPGSSERRRLQIAARLYDQGVPQVIAVRKIRIIDLAADPSTQTQTEISLSYTGSELVAAGSLPAKGRYEWVFGDGSPGATSEQPRIPHAYPAPKVQPGHAVTRIRDMVGNEFTASVQVFDATSGKLVGKASSTFRVGGALRTIPVTNSGSGTP